MRRYSCAVFRTHVYEGIVLIVVTLSRALAFAIGIELMKRPGPTLRVRLRETGSTPDMRLVPYLWLAGVCLSLNRWPLHFQWRARNG